MSKEQGTDVPPDRAVPMRVIVCGLHRTGTLSMRTALRRLGFHDCYHMLAAIESMEDHPAQWIRAIEAKYAGKGRAFAREDWDRLLGVYQACCDMPAALFGCELAAAYPEAKVVILNRDPERWYESVLGSVAESLSPTRRRYRLARLYICVFNPTMRRWYEFLSCMARLSMPFDYRREKEKALAWFDERYAEFREKIPEHRRIEYSVQDGWGPLCEHLGVPIPTKMDDKTGEIVTEPFPNVNNRASHLAEEKRLISRVIAQANYNIMNVVGRVCTLACLAYGVYIVWKARL